MKRTSAHISANLFRLKLFSSMLSLSLMRKISVQRIVLASSPLSASASLHSAPCSKRKLFTPDSERPSITERTPAFTCRSSRVHST